MLIFVLIKVFDFDFSILQAHQVLHPLLTTTHCPPDSLHTKLYKGARNVSANNSETVGHKDLRLGQIVYILVFHIFLLRDSENDLYALRHLLRVFREQLA